MAKNSIRQNYFAAKEWSFFMDRKYPIRKKRRKILAKKLAMKQQYGEI